MKMSENKKGNKVKDEIIKIDSNDYFRRLSMNKISKILFNENIKKIKKLTNNELVILNSYKNICYIFINKMLLLHKFPKILNKNNLTSCFLPYIKDKTLENMTKDEILLSIYYSINKFDKIFSKMNILPNIKIYRGIKNPLFNYIENKKSKCENVFKVNNKKPFTKNEIINKIETNKFQAFNKVTGFNSNSLISYKNLKKNDILQYDSYQSTTINPNIAMNFISYADETNEKVFLEINIKKEDKVPFIFLTDILFTLKSKKELKQINDWDKTKYDEFEILLPRNIQYKVVSKKIYKIKKDVSGFENYFSNKSSYKEIMYIKMIVLPYQKPKKLDASYFTYLPKYLLV